MLVPQMTLTAIHALHQLRSEGVLTPAEAAMANSQWRRETLEVLRAALSPDDFQRLYGHLASSLA